MSGLACRDVPGRRAGAGFTLVEVLASIFLTSVVLTLALSLHVQTTNQAEIAAASLRSDLQSANLATRLARDLEGAFLLVKPPDTDPLYHPWLFLAESYYTSGGSDRIKFVTRSHHNRSTQTQSARSELTTVVFLLRPSELDDGSFDLLRWVSPGVSETLERDFPVDEESAMLLAEGVEHFALRFLTETGEWAETWDSSTLLESGQLPLAVEIEVGMVDASLQEFEAEFASDEEAHANTHTRRVLLPVRPVDLVAVVERDAGISDGTGESAGCVLVGDCIRQHEGAVNDRLKELGWGGFGRYAVEYQGQCIQDTPAAEALIEICGGGGGL